MPEIKLHAAEQEYAQQSNSGSLHPPKQKHVTFLPYANAIRFLPRSLQSNLLGGTVFRGQ
jgi:hypothetical protein